MFLHACAFADYVEHYNRVPKDDMHRATWYSTPKIVNIAFACEIFLKALLVFNNVSYERAHNLEQLCSLLPVECREIIERETVDRFGSTKDAIGIAYISRISEVFTDWRYSFEKARLSIDLSVLWFFCALFRELCCQKMYGESWETIQRRMK